MSRDSVGHTFKVAFLLCVVCSVLVSGAAVGLRPKQERNRVLEVQKNILLAADLIDSPDVSANEVRSKFEQVERRLVNLETGEYVELSELGLEDYDPRKAARDPQLSVQIPPRQDIAGFKRREKYAYVYLVQDPDGGVSKIVLPVYGRGLWSTLYGFLALDRNTREIRGLTFHEHGETPGLGGEVDNESWKAQWKGKEAFDEEWDVAVRVPKGEVNPNDPDAIHKVDGLSGATITARGVENLLRFWLGENGFGPYLERMRTEGGIDG